MDGALPAAKKDERTPGEKKEEVRPLGDSGDTEAGAVAALTTPRISVISGGLACIAGVAVLARLVPEFVRYRASDAPVYSLDGPVPATKGEPHG